MTLRSPLLTLLALLAAAACGGEPGLEPLTRTVTGTYQIECMGESGPAVRSEDLSAYSVSALVPDATAGGYAVYPGVGLADGTFQISSVPRGGFFIRLVKTPGSGERFEWTERSQVHLGGRRIGRPDWAVAPGATALEIRPTGMGSGAMAELVVPTLGLWRAEFLGRLVAGTWRFDVAGMPLPEVGKDPGYLTTRTHATQGNLTIGTIGGLLPLPAQGLAGGATTTVAATPDPVPPGNNTVDVSLDADAFLATLSGIATASELGNLTYALRSQPYGATEAQLSGPTLLNVSVLDAKGTVSRPGVTYADPFPAAWSKVVVASQAVFKDYKSAAGSDYSVGFAASAQHLANALPAGALRPLVGPVRSFRVNGRPVSTAGLSIGSSPEFTWEAPATGTPSYYIFSLDRLIPAPPPATTLTMANVASFRTTRPWVAVPAGLLVAGQEYVATVWAVSSGSYDLAYPARTTLPLGVAPYMSELLVP